VLLKDALDSMLLTLELFLAIKHGLASISSCEDLLDEEALSSHAIYAFLPYPAL